jgi:acetyl-CoA carboxylase biotin carboxyl carrier protein
MKTKKPSDTRASGPPARRETGRGGLGVDLEEIERLLQFMNEHGLEEFEFAQGGLHIRLRKAATVPAAGMRMPVPVHPEIVVAGPSPSSSLSAQQASGPAEPASPDAGASAEGLHLVKSPIVGTYYGAPSPGAEPFVKVGDAVRTGQVLCIIEAMKLMNEIESDAAGEVVRTYAENGQPVEYGQPLFAIRPTRKK